MALFFRRPPVPQIGRQQLLVIGVRDTKRGDSPGRVADADSVLLAGRTNDPAPAVLWIYGQQPTVGTGDKIDAAQLSGGAGGQFADPC
jgi:hypothetical protein